MVSLPAPVRRLTAVGAVGAAVATATVLTGPASAAVTAPTTGVTVHVEDPDDVLGPADEQMLGDQTPTVDLPDQVREVDYLILGDSENDLDADRDNFNDVVLEWVGKHRSDLVPGGTGRGETWENGTLLIAVGLDPHGNGVYCGDDVCSALDLFEGRHLDQTLEDMKPGLRRGNYQVGMLDGLRTAADPSKKTEESSIPWWLWVVIPVALLGPLAGVLGWLIPKSRKKKAATAREQFTGISDEYGAVAQRLDQIDVRAHSLTSAIADAELRAQWDDVRGEFLTVNDLVGRTGLTPTSTDKEFRRHAGEVEQAHTAVTRMTTAEDNIDRIFAMEQGEATARQRGLTDLIVDIHRAQAENGNPEVGRQLDDLEVRFRNLRDAPGTLDAPDFMDRFAALVTEYSGIIGLVEKDMTHLNLDAPDRVPPRIWDTDYRIGTGYNGWVPYATVSAWHSADVSSYNASRSSSSTNTTFSSGFSGGGGSSSW